MRVARWWPLPFGVGLIVIGVFVQAPYPFTGDGFVTHTAFAIAGVLLLALPWHGFRNRRWRSMTAMVVAGACATRAAVLLFVPRVPPITWQSKIVGSVAWMLLGCAVAALMVTTWPPQNGHSVPDASP